jgi:hypothetical protein
VKQRPRILRTLSFMGLISSIKPFIFTSRPIIQGTYEHEGGTAEDRSLRRRSLHGSDR